MFSPTILDKFRSSRISNTLINNFAYLIISIIFISDQISNTLKDITQKKTFKDNLTQQTNNRSIKIKNV
ncbi:MAG: hypothetical protein EBU19_05165 [Gammaproteobacteria bacterium]|jgi:hypothetical protein|nr:hypothetical protein [Gammaproteobacteria bacterium]